MFTKQVLREGRIPFEISVNRPNRETVKALEESDELYAKYLKNPSKVKTYTVNEAVREMNWVSEMFDEIAAKTQSKEFIAAIHRIHDKMPEDVKKSIEIDIESAEQAMG